MTDIVCFVMSRSVCVCELLMQLPLLSHISLSTNSGKDLLMINQGKPMLMVFSHIVPKAITDNPKPVGPH